MILSDVHCDLLLHFPLYQLTIGCRSDIILILNIAISPGLTVKLAGVLFVNIGACDIRSNYKCRIKWK